MAQRVERRLAAILAADIVGYSRLTERDEAGTLVLIRDLRERVIDPLLAEHRGHIVKLLGDGAIAEFGSVVDAVACAVAVQKATTGQQADVPADRRIVFRIGVNLGDVVVEGDDLLGDGVNVAARLEQLCQPGGVLISGTAYDQLQGKFGLPLDFTGEQRLKNIERPVRAYRVRLDGAAAPRRLRLLPPSRWRVPLGASVIALGLIVAGALAWHRLWQAPPPPPATPTPVAASAPALDPRRLAVLPFANISAEAKNEWFADGITEEIITRLSQIPELSVIARTSIMGYKGTSKGVAEIGRELSAGTILEGSVRRAGDQVRVTAQLVDSGSQAHLWAESYDRPMRQIFAVQSDIAAKVADALQITLLAEVKQRVERSGTSDPIAHDLYLRGRHAYSQWTVQGFREAASFFEQAIQLDPAYASAHAALGQVWVDMPWLLPVSAREALAKATAAAEKALALDEDLADAHTLLGYTKLYLWDWPGAEAAFKRSLELNPDGSLALTGYNWGYLTQIRGRYDEAIEGMRHAREVDPLSWDVVSSLGWLLYHAGRYEDAIEQWHQARKMSPDSPVNFLNPGVACIALHRYEEAVRWLEQAVRLAQGHWEAKSRLGWAYGRAGRTKEARAVLDDLTRRYSEEKFSPMAFVFVYQGLGDLDKAFLWLERSYEAQDYLLFFLQGREFEDLWGDPRYAAMKAKIGFPPRG
jgi:TolB-like protein/class 3 adenylate cyclase/Flp pilus assembly protein TadD